MTQSLKGPFGDAEADALRERNAARVAETIARMGRSYLLHPSQRVTRLAKPYQDGARTLRVLH